jgi:flagellar hook-associated protein 3 FlgL
MTWLSLGSLALPFQLQRQGVNLRGEIAQIGVELTTGQSSDPAQRLRGETGALSALTARLSRLEAFDQNARMLSARTEVSQTALGRADTARERVAAGMLAAAVVSADAASLTAAGTTANNALQDVIQSLNQRVGGQSLFAGAATDATPLPDAASMIAAVLPLVAGLDSAEAVAATIDSAFTAPGGLFDTTFYQGAAAAPGALLDTGAGSLDQPTAANPAIRGLLAALVTSALTAEPALPLGLDQRRSLAKFGAESLLGNASALSALQGQVGEMQATLEGTLLQFQTEKDSLTTARQDLIGIDPYKAASRLEEARTQLETLYTVTARTARLSLAGYLR